MLVERGDEPRYQNYFKKRVEKTVYDTAYWIALPRLQFTMTEAERAFETVYGLGKLTARGWQRDARQGGTGHREAVPPLTNRGGKSSTEAQAVKLEGTKLQDVELVLDKGQVKTVQVRVGWGDDLCIVDQLSFTFHESTCHIIAGHRLVADGEFLMAMSAKLQQLFGFGVSHKRPKGMNFYEETYVLGQEDVLYGHLSFGGQKDTMLVQLTATGLNAAKEGWENRLYEFLTTQAQQPRLTRIDLAYDDFGGVYAVELAYQDYKNGLYNTGGRNPFCEKRGDWDNPDQSGRTIYFGKRANGKYCRVYEKGRQLGSKTSEWVRVEVELKNVDRVLPFEILIEPGRFFAGAYPAFEQFKGNRTPERIATQEKEMEHAVDHYLHYASIQVGRLLTYLSEIGNWSADAIVRTLKGDKGQYPQRLKLANLSHEFGNQDFIHHWGGDYAHA